MVKTNNKILLVIIIIFLVLLSFLIIYRAYTNYSQWRNYHNYFSQENPQIQSWMNLNTISKRFNLTDEELNQALDINGTKVNKHISLDRFCKEYNKECSVIVENLNQLIKK